MSSSKPFTSVIAAGAAALILVGSSAYANHPVYVEGNNGAAPGATSVPPGTSGDFDGDGLIGIAEDTDNATDRVFGTIAAALDALNGAANNNGSVIIVTSGRFNESVSITGANGNVNLEAAPGVEGSIDAVLGGDPNNAARQALSGIVVNAPVDRRVTLRNLVLRNWTKGIEVSGSSNVAIMDCRFENNRDYGIHVLGAAKVLVDGCEVLSSGFRTGSGVDNTPAPGVGIQLEGTSMVLVARTAVAFSFAGGIVNSTGNSKSLRTIDSITFNNKNGLD